MRRARFTLLCSTVLIGGLGAAMLPAGPSFIAPAAAQQRVEVRTEFRTALEPYGRFERHSRYGEVWRPTRISKEWRPYTEGRWVYTDDWGWYWNAAETESDWGWVAYHYGRWIDDEQMGWVWVPGDEWGPAWVNWRRGESRDARPSSRRGPSRGADQSARFVGWSPLPPDDMVSEVRDDPRAWTFVRAQDIVAPRISRVVVRSDVRQQLIRETVVVNRTVVVRDRGPQVIVNPGIDPGFVAAVLGRPIRTYEVRPRVFVGTGNVRGAVEVRGEDLRDRRRFEQNRVIVRETQTTIRPAANIAPPRPLEVNEQGRLGDNPPRAARGGADQQREPGAGGERTPSTQEPRTGDRQPGVAPGERAPTTTTTQPGREPATPGTAPTTTTREGAPDRAREPQGRDATQKPATPGAAPTTTTREGAPDRAREPQGRDATQKPATPGAAPTTTTREGAPDRVREPQGRDATQKPATPPAASAPATRERSPGAQPDAPGRSGAAPGRETSGERSERGQQQRAPAAERGPAGERGQAGQREGGAPSPAPAATPARPSPAAGAGAGAAEPRGRKPDDGDKESPRGRD